jgi:hypothetical protein
LHREYGGVEALQVPDLEDAAAIFRSPDQVVGLVEVCGQGLLDQQIEARLEELCGDRVVMQGGDGDGNSVEV